MEENLGLLSNDEVLAVLKDREADKQPVVSRAAPSEIQAYTALLQQHSGGDFKDREQLQRFIEALQVWRLGGLGGHGRLDVLADVGEKQAAGSRPCVDPGG